MNAFKLIPILSIIVISISCNTETKTDPSEESIVNNNIIELTGMAYDRKGGAVIDCDGTHYWIEEMEFWEEKYVNKIITITGILEKRADNPVFLDTGTITKQGIPVNSEKELQAQENRFWIKDAVIKSMH